MARHNPRMTYPGAPPGTADRDSGARFPLRVAAIDIGSNAIRFQAALFTSPGKYSVLDSRRATVRLGHNSFISGALHREAMDEAIVALRSFRASLNELGITAYRAIATSAVRESSNGELFVKRCAREAGLSVEIINGAEEARLVYLAVKKRIPLVGKQWLIANLGGGSLEISLARGPGIAWSETHRMGAVRLYEELTEDGREPPHYIKLLTEYVSTLRISKRYSSAKPLELIATGGNIEDLARLAGCKPDASGVSVISTGKLRQVTGLLSGSSYRKRVEKLGLKKDRADVILPAAVIYGELARLARVRRLIAPNTGTREGILFDLVDRMTTRTARDARIERELSEAALLLGKHYKFDKPHSEHVAEMALSLFDQLGDIHELGPADRNILLAGAMLHDIGSYISYKGHHKHSYYLISQSELPGLTDRELAMAANVARYHRKAEPSVHHEFFFRLSQDERDRVAKLASLLRMSDALDREHAQNVRGITAIAERPYLTLVPDLNGDINLERWALKKKDKLFQRIFGLKVRIGKAYGSN